MTTQQKLSEKIFVIDAEINIWSGQRKLDATDIRLGQGGELPPETVANLGNKKIADPKSLSPFHRIKTAMRRYLAEIGMPFLGGWACPLDRFDEVKARMEQYQIEFGNAKTRFLSSYDSAVEDWIASNPNYESEIRRGVMHRDDVEKRIKFGFNTFKMVPAADSEGQRLERRVAGLGDDLLLEIAESAARFADQLIGREAISATTSITLKGLRDKIEGLAFLNGNLQPVADLLSDTLSGYQLHRDGRNIVAPFIYQVQAVALTLADVDRIEKFARGEIDIKAQAKVVEQMETGSIPNPVTAVTQPVAEVVPVAPVTPVAPVAPVVQAQKTDTEAADLFADLDELLPAKEQSADEPKPAQAEVVNEQPQPEAAAVVQVPAEPVVVTTPAPVTQVTPVEGFDIEGDEGFGF